MMCVHKPECPSASSPGHDAAVTVAHDYSTGYSRRCNGVICFEDGGEILPDGTVTGACRGPAPHADDTDINWRVEVQLTRLKLVEAQLRAALDAAKAESTRPEQPTTPTNVPGVVNYVAAHRWAFVLWVGAFTYSLIMALAYAIVPMFTSP